MKRNEQVNLKGPIFLYTVKLALVGVAIGCIANNKLDVLEKKNDKNIRTLILDALNDDTNFILVSIQ